jgi:hypothetical protein
LQVFAANVTLIMLRYDEPPRFAPPPSYDDRGRGGYGDRCVRFFAKLFKRTKSFHSRGRY